MVDGTPQEDWPHLCTDRGLMGEAVSMFVKLLVLVETLP